MFLVPEEAVRIAALRAGDADIAPVSLAAKGQVEAGDGQMVFGPEGIISDVRWYGCWQPPAEEYPPCNDRRVRQALVHALDRKLIQEKLYGGPEVFEIRGWWRATPNSNGYTPEVDNVIPFDADKARQLLADAGYPGGEGFGKLILSTAPSSSLPLVVEAAQLGAEMWRKELGLDVEVRVGDRTAIKRAGRDGELKGQVTWMDNEARRDLTGTILGFYGDPRIEKPLSALHDDRELIAIVQPAMEILDKAEREAAIKKLVPRLAQESYHLNVGYVHIPWGVGPRVLTWQPWPLATYPSALHTVTLK